MTCPVAGAQSLKLRDIASAVRAGVAVSAAYVAPEAGQHGHKGAAGASQPGSTGGAAGAGEADAHSLDSSDSSDEEQDPGRRTDDADDEHADAKVRRASGNKQR